MGWFYRDVDLSKAYESGNREFNLGDRAIIDDDAFIFVKFNEGDGSDAGTAGNLLIGLDSAYEKYEGTCDPNSGTIKAILQFPLGFLQATLTDEEKGWAQYKGYNRIAVVSDGSVAQGERIMPHATTSGCIDTRATTLADIGVALEDDNGSLAIGEVYIDIPI